MTDTGRIFLMNSSRLMTEEYLQKIEKCISQLDDKQIWWRPNNASNSIGNLMLHLAGNIRQWIISGIGGAPDSRVRQLEFDETGPMPREELLDRLHSTVSEAAQVIAEFDPERLLDSRKIQNQEPIILEAIYHVVEHFSMHTGQIILMTKQQTGKDLRFYDL